MYVRRCREAWLAQPCGVVVHLLASCLGCAAEVQSALQLQHQPPLLPLCCTAARAHAPPPFFSRRDASMHAHMHVL